MDEPSPVAHALRRLWWLPVLLALFGAGGGVAFGLHRHPTYSATARLSVGRVDVATQSIPGFTVAAQTLADVYSRAILAPAIVRPLQQQFRLSADQVAARIDASPIPTSTVLLVDGRGPEAGDAVRLANAAAQQLVAYARSINQNNPDSRRLLDRYRAASDRYGIAVAARARVDPGRTGAVARANARVAAANLDLKTTADLYSGSLAGQSSPNTLQVLALGVHATSDRRSVLERAILVGALAGLGLGLLVVLLFSRWRVRRRS